MGNTASRILKKSYIIPDPFNLKRLFLRLIKLNARYDLMAPFLQYIQGTK